MPLPARSGVGAPAGAPAHLPLPLPASRCSPSVSWRRWRSCACGTTACASWTRCTSTSPSQAGAPPALVHRGVPGHPTSGLLRCSAVLAPYVLRLCIRGTATGAWGAARQPLAVVTAIWLAARLFVRAARTQKQHTARCTPDTAGTRHVTLRSLPGMLDRCLRIGSAGKTFSFTAWKVRAAVAWLGATRAGGARAPSSPCGQHSKVGMPPLHSLSAQRSALATPAQGLPSLPAGRGAP